MLLQLKKSDWQTEGGKGGRIRHALVFQRAEADPDGKISKKHWPAAGKTWPWILYSSAILNTKPFSLEGLQLNRPSHYQSQANPVRIEPPDEAIILSYLMWSTTVPLAETSSLDVRAPIATDDTRDVERFSVEQACSIVKSWLPHAHVEVMRHNYPGFDLVVTERGQVVRYIEVKGTRSLAPVFHLTETERRFSAENASLYTLLVVWAIDLACGTYKLSQLDGEVVVGSVLRPERYSGRLPAVQ